MRYLLPILTAEERQAGEYTKYQAGVSAIKNKAWSGEREREMVREGKGDSSDSVSKAASFMVIWGKAFHRGAVSTEGPSSSVTR